MDTDNVHQVRVLTDETFTSFLDQNDQVLVGFILPFLEATTKRFLKEFEKAAQHLRTQDVQLAVLDCQKEIKVYEQFTYNRWPTVKLFRNATVVKQYEGAWVSADITSWVMRLSLPIALEVDSRLLQRLEDQHEVVIVGHRLTEHSRSVFLSSATVLHEDYVFGELIKENPVPGQVFQVSRVSQVTIYKKFDEKEIAIDVLPDVERMCASIRSASTPFVEMFYPEIYRTFVDRGLPLGHLIARTASDLEVLQPAVLSTAMRYKDRFITGTVNFSIFESIKEELHLPPEKLPVFAIKDVARGRRYILQDAEIMEQAVSSFVEDFMNDKLECIVRSEPIPEVQHGPVTVIVGDTFDNIVIQNEKDVLVDYYTQWCGPCKAVAPMYERIAEIYTSNPEISERVCIAKVDAEANDVPGSIRGFPTFKLFPGRAKMSPVQYLGPWTIKGFANFVRDEGTHRIDVFKGCDADLLYQEPDLEQEQVFRRDSE